MAFSAPRDYRGAGKGHGGVPGRVSPPQAAPAFAFGAATQAALPSRLAVASAMDEAREGRVSW